MRVAVTDDDPVVTARIKEMIEAEDPHAAVSTFRSGEELLLIGQPFDIVYLDICMDGSDGVATAKRLRSHYQDVLIIFVSGLRDSVFDAMDVHPFHFLLKPLDPERFTRVYQEAREAAARQARSSGGHLLIRNRRENVLVPARDIVYIESKSRKLEVHTVDQVYEMYGALGSIESELGGGFYRTHRAFLVNMNWIKAYQSDSIELRNGEKAFLTKKKYGAFVKAYMWFLQSKHGAS